MLTRRALLVGGAATVPTVLLSPRALAAPPVTGQVPAQLAGLDTRLKNFIAARSVSSAQFAVGRHGKLLLARGYGTYNAGAAKVQPTTLFRLASLSKHITGAAIMRLVQDRKLSLGAKVAPLLGLSTSAEPRLADITVLRLMHQLSGWDKAASGKDYLFSDHAISAALDVPLPITHAHILKYATSRPLDFAPGSRMSYNNLNFTLLGRVIEKVSGLPYATYVQRHILGPAGVTRPRISPSVPPSTGVRYESKFTTKTVLDDSGTVVPHPYGGANYPNLDSTGGWMASAVDLVRLSRVFDGSTSVLTKTTLARLWAEPEIGRNEHGSWYSGGWWVRRAGSGFNTWHNGSLPGTYTILTRTNFGVCFAATFNRREETGSPDFDALQDELYDAVAAIRTWPTTDLTSRYF
ncbi:serine hydrolase domain-containing protein [Nonomuraea longicatena]